MTDTETKYFRGSKVTLHWDGSGGAVDAIPYDSLNAESTCDLVQYLKENDNICFTHFSFVLKAFGMAFPLYEGDIKELSYNMIEYFLEQEPFIRISYVNVFDSCLYITLKSQP